MNSERNLNFCTLFDKGFLIKGLALHDSLVRHGGSFTLWVLCMDDETKNVLSKLNLSGMRLLSLSDIEDNELARARQNRSLRKYYFTLSPALPLYILEHNDIPSITYLDADLYFFSSPEVIYEEMGDKSIMIIPHRLGPSRKEKEKEVGKYNVGMLIFKKDESGLACLKWWREQCITYCTDNQSSEFYDDQKFLDHFEEKFKGVHIMKNLGANLAPWNIVLDKIRRHNGTIYVDRDKLVFFHFSGFALYPKSIILPYGPYTFHEYTRSSLLKTSVYRPYAMCLYKMLDKVKSIFPKWEYGMTIRPKTTKGLRQFFNNSIKFPSEKLAKVILSTVFKL